MQNLLTVHPLADEEMFARISCIRIEEDGPEIKKPFVCKTLGEFEECLSGSFSPSEIREIVILLNSGETVHRLIDDRQARAIGFIAQIQ